MVGKNLLQYRVEEQIGAGGMGVVYRATDTKLGRAVALKVLPDAHALSGGRRERLFREARAASALNHPGIVSIHEINDDGEVAFIAMELVEGESLAQLVHRGALGLQTALHYGWQIADALAAAHEAGIVHRDLKPGNVMVTKDGRTKLLDFGLAKRVEGKESDGAGAAEATLTLEGMVVGTPAYMSPEQALGGELDPRSDQFSFGVILAEMLTGVRPFQGASSTAILREVISGKPHGVDELRGRVPAPLLALIERTLAKSAEDRFPNMREVAGHLKRLAGIPTSEHLETSLEIRQEKRRFGTGARIVAAACVLAAIAGVAWWRQRGAGVEPASALIDSSLPVTELMNRGNELLRTRFRKGNIDRAKACFEAALMKQPGFAPAQAGLALATFRKARAARTPGLLETAVSQAREAVRLDTSLARSHVALGVALSADSKTFAEAERELRHALELDPRNYEALTGLAMVYGLSRRDKEQEELLLRAVGLYPSGWDAKASLGGMYYRRGDYQNSVIWLERSREVAPDNADNYRSLAGVYHMLDRYDDAAEALQYALQSDPQPATYSNLGTLRFFQGRYGESRQHFLKALELQSDRYLYWGNYGDACRWTPGQEAEASKAYEKAIALANEELKKAEGDPELMSSRAAYLAKSGRRSEALDAVTQVAVMPNLKPGVWYKLAVTTEVAGNRDLSLDYLSRAIKGGYSMKEVLADPELAQLRATGEFRKLAERRK